MARRDPISITPSVCTYISIALGLGQVVGRGSHILASGILDRAQDDVALASKPFTMDSKDVESFPTRTISAAGSVSTANVGRDALADVTPPHESYEGRHRFDPTAKWTDAEERRVVRKTDTYLLSALCVMFFGLQLDRGNLSNALADNLLNDLNLSTDDYNNGTTIQLLCFLAAEFPAQILIKRYGFKYILPTMMFLWGTVSWAQAWMTDRTSFYITRAFIGMCEGGFIRR